MQAPGSGCVESRDVCCTCPVVDGPLASGIPAQVRPPGGAIELAGEHVRGIAVHIGARVAAMAGPREVLVSSTVKDLVAGLGDRIRGPGRALTQGHPRHGADLPRRVRLM